MTLDYLCTLDLPDSWFSALADRVSQVKIHRVTAGERPPAALLQRIQMLHTSEWFPHVAEVPHLRCVQLDTSGVDHVRGTSLWDTDIPIATLGGIAPVPMAEYAMMAILELAHRMPRIVRQRETRAWPSNSERLAEFTPRQLTGSTLGVIGYGRIGREISRLASAFGMRVLGVKRTVEAALLDTTTVNTHKFDTGQQLGLEDRTEIYPMDRLAEALARCEFVVVVVPLTELTRGMIAGAELDLLPAGAYLINIARGGIVDEGALRERLHDGRIAGAVLDVFDEEPLTSDSPWWSAPNTLITPHVAGLAPQYHAQTLDLVAQNLTRLATGMPILNEVDRVSGY